MRKPIAVRVGHRLGGMSPEEVIAAGLADLPPPDERLPDAAVIEAGVAKFRELAKRHWPSGKPGKDFELDSFDPGNDWHLRMTLAMVFQAMKAAEQ